MTTNKRRKKIVFLKIKMEAYWIIGFIMSFFPLIIHLENFSISYYLDSLPSSAISSLYDPGQVT